MVSLRTKRHSNQSHRIQFSSLVPLVAASTLLGRIIVLIGGVLRMAMLVEDLNLLRILLEALIVLGIDDDL